MGQSTQVVHLELGCAEGCSWSIPGEERSGTLEAPGLIYPLDAEFHGYLQGHPKKPWSQNGNSGSVDDQHRSICVHHFLSDWVRWSQKKMCRPSSFEKEQESSTNEVSLKQALVFFETKYHEKFVHSKELGTFTRNSHNYWLIDWIFPSLISIIPIPLYIGSVDLDHLHEKLHLLKLRSAAMAFGGPPSWENDGQRELENPAVRWRPGRIVMRVCAKNICMLCIEVSVYLYLLKGCNFFRIFFPVFCWDFFPFLGVWWFWLVFAAFCS